MKFFKNLVKESENSPALMILIVLMTIALVVVTISNFFDIILLIFGIICLILNIKSYRRKY